ncbi:hypothetical protein Clacol_009199 [Clathrus columnatus]|uniref:DASH complex subunit DAM1 n=1 Tax=Clathrus columnatus TaxID=1419009 RepID=A0AAV5AP41_9AGAM|nr:hypothetical protein Clacol_009199 [Clathrus columnatus]
MSTAPHRTPLRRVSRGSLSALSRSHNDNSSPAGLQFLGPALEILTDEVDALSQNVDGLNKLSSSLKRFNESFASYLFMQKINVFSVEWFEAPTEESHELAAQRQEARHAAAAALEVARRNQQHPQSAPVTAKADSVDHTLPCDTTFGLSEIHEAPGPNNAKSKKKVKPKLTAKERKERTMIFEKVCAILPLEFRGGDPTLRRQVEHVLDCLLDSKRNGLKSRKVVRKEVNPVGGTFSLTDIRFISLKEFRVEWYTFGKVYHDIMIPFVRRHTVPMEAVFYVL